MKFFIYIYFLILFFDSDIRADELDQGGIERIQIMAGSWNLKIDQYGAASLIFGSTTKSEIKRGVLSFDSMLEELQPLARKPSEILGYRDSVEGEYVGVVFRRENQNEATSLYVKQEVVRDYFETAIMYSIPGSFFESNFDNAVKEKAPFSLEVERIIFTDEELAEHASMKDLQKKTRFRQDSPTRTRRKELSHLKPDSASESAVAKKKFQWSWIFIIFLITGMGSFLLKNWKIKTIAS